MKKSGQILQNRFYRADFTGYPSNFSQGADETEDFSQVCFHFEKLVDDEVVYVSEKKVKLVEIKLP